YQVAVNALAEVGLAPGPELRMLEQGIAAQDQADDLAAARVTAGALEAATTRQEWSDSLDNAPTVLVVDHERRSTTLDLLTQSARTSDAVVLHGEMSQVSARPFAVVADALRPILTT